MNSIAKTIIHTSIYAATALFPSALGKADMSSKNNLFNKIEKINTYPQKKIKTYTEMLNGEEVSSSIGWNNNIRVLASNGQKRMAHTICINSFSAQLINKLKNKDIYTIEQANDSLAKNGYYTLTKRYYSLETPGENLDVFNKKEVDKEFDFNLNFLEKPKPKKRFLLTCFQNDNDKFYSNDFRKTEQYFTDNIEGIYKIPKENIIRISAKSKEDFLAGLDSMANKIRGMKDSLNTELLVLYVGHCGARDSKIEADTIKEGSSAGYILTEFDKDRQIKKTLWESELQKILNEKFKNCRSLILFDTCFSGAFIAENTKNNVKKALKLLG